MRRHALVRWGGGAAVAGGTLRGVTALLPPTHTIATHLIYLAVDLLLLLAVVGVYAFQRGPSGRGPGGGLGAFGALLAAVGAGLLIIDDLFSPTFALYPIAAVVFALGLGALALGAWRARTLPRWIAGIWLVAIVIGALSLGIPTLQVLIVAAGLLFAVGFVGAGLFLIAAPDSASRESPQLHGDKSWS